MGRWGKALGAAAAWGLAAFAAAAQPQRVVTINLCADQLAMLLAAPGQLVSVSDVASDPLSSAMVVEAAAYRANRGQAEEVFVLRPDLVIAGTYTTRATVALLRRLGIEVAEIAPAASLGEVRARILEVGALLGREAAAREMAARFDADLAALRGNVAERPRAALYYANGYTSGSGTLASEILAAAGFANIAEEAGVEGGGILPLESLVMAAPDLVVTGARYKGASRSEEILEHPALAVLGAGRARTGPDWVCATPHVLAAVARLADARRALGGAAE